MTRGRGPREGDPERGLRGRGNGTGREGDPGVGLGWPLGRERA